MEFLFENANIDIPACDRAMFRVLCESLLFIELTH